MSPKKDELLRAWESAMRWWWDGMSDLRTSEALLSDAAVQEIHSALEEAHDEAELRLLYESMPHRARHILDRISDDVSDLDRVRDVAFWLRYFELREDTKKNTSIH